LGLIIARLLCKLGLIILVLFLPKLRDSKKAAARDCPSNLIKAMGLFKQGDCISTRRMGDINVIQVAEKIGIAHKPFGANLLPYC
jgi:hypothetical protein